MASLKSKGAFGILPQHLQGVISPLACHKVAAFAIALRSEGWCRLIDCPERLALRHRGANAVDQRGFDQRLSKVALCGSALPIPGRKRDLVEHGIELRPDLVPLGARDVA